MRPTDLSHRQMMCRVLGRLVLQVLPAVARQTPDEWQDRAAMLLVDLRYHPMRVLAPFSGPMDNSADALPTPRDRALFGDLACALAASMLLGACGITVGDTTIAHPEAQE